MELLEEFGVQRDRVEADLQPDYNVAPTKPVYAVLTRGPRSSADSASSEEPPERQLRVVRWGLVPYWAKDPAIGSRMINARAETVAEKPAFRRAFARRRCLLPADGFYEWQQVTDGGGKRKQPYYIYRADGGGLAFAGLYELWRDSSVPEDHPGGWLWTATIITTRAQDEVGRIHDRMPMVIEPSAWQDWLDPGNTDVADVGRLLVPAASGGLTTHPVSTAVNNVRNNGPGLTDVLPDAGPASASPDSLARSGPSGEHPPDGAPAGSGDTLF
jgi:putative SOS response-associated peptidase YedK